MVRSLAKGLAVLALSVASTALGQMAPTTPAVRSSAAPSGERIITVQELNRPAQKCRVLRSWRTSDGTTAYQVQGTESGEMMTIVEAGALAMPASPGRPHIRAVATRIYHWGKSTYCPSGVPQPPSDRAPGSPMAERLPTHDTRIQKVQALEPENPSARPTPSAQPRPMRVAAESLQQPSPPYGAIPPAPRPGESPWPTAHAGQPPRQLTSAPRTIGSQVQRQPAQVVTPISKTEVIAAMPTPGPVVSSSDCMFPPVCCPAEPRTPLWKRLFKRNSCKSGSCQAPCANGDKIIVVPCPGGKCGCGSQPATTVETKPTPCASGDKIIVVPCPGGKCGCGSLPATTVETKPTQAKQFSQDRVLSERIITVPDPGKKVEEPHPVIKVDTAPAQPRDYRESWGKIEASKPVVVAKAPEEFKPVTPVLVPKVEKVLEMPPLPVVESKPLPAPRVEKVIEMPPVPMVESKPVPAPPVEKVLEMPPVPVVESKPLPAPRVEKAIEMPPVPMVESKPVPAPRVEKAIEMPPVPMVESKPVPAPRTEKVVEPKPVELKKPEATTWQLPDTSKTPASEAKQPETKKAEPKKPGFISKIFRKGETKKKPEEPAKAEIKKAPEAKASDWEATGSALKQTSTSAKATTSSDAMLPHAKAADSDPLSRPMEFVKKKPETKPPMSIPESKTVTVAKKSPESKTVTVAKKSLPDTAEPTKKGDVQISQSAKTSVEGVPLGAGSVMQAGSPQYIPVPVQTVPNTTMPSVPPPPQAPQPNLGQYTPVNHNITPPPGYRNAFTNPGPQRPLPSETIPPETSSNAFSDPPIEGQGTPPPEIPALLQHSPARGALTGYPPMPMPMQRAPMQLPDPRTVPQQSNLPAMPTQPMGPATPLTSGGASVPGTAWMPANYFNNMGQAAQCNVYGMQQGASQVCYQQPVMDMQSHVAMLMKMLQESDYPSQREWAAEQLANQGLRSSPNAVNAMIAAAKEDPAPTVRASCVRCLVRMGVNTVPVVGLMQELHADADPRVRDAALEALKSMGVAPTKQGDIQPASGHK